MARIRWIEDFSDGALTRAQHAMIASYGSVRLADSFDIHPPPEREPEGVPRAVTGD
jgi:hypothetical protein